MGKDLLNEFVNRGWLDRSVTEGFDPYWELAWFAEGDWRGGDAYGACEVMGVGAGDLAAEDWF